MKFSATLLLLVVCAAAFSALACTVVYVGPEASTTGSSFIGHSSDGGATTDPRLVWIEGRATGGPRPIYPSPESYPRYVGYARGAEPYFPLPGQAETEPIGHIPQPYDFSHPYLEETYGAANPYIGVAEATCSAVYVATPVNEGGSALLSIDELSRIAMERTKTATCAVNMMGELAVKYGFYGPGSFEGSGESLIVADTKEGWIFHVLPDSTGKSAIWAAQRIPANHVAVIANMFTIRNIDLTDTTGANFLFSPTLASHARLRNCSSAASDDTVKSVDFAGCFSNGEYAHKYYSGRRVWRAYDLLAPQLKLSPTYTNLLTDAPYPVSAPPAEKVSLERVFSLYRDYLQGTEFDLTTGLASGPFGTPDRYTGGEGERSFKNGWWERPIGLFRTSDTYVVEFRPTAPAEMAVVLWFGPHAAHGTVFTPFLASASSVPDSYSYGHQKTFNRTTAFWAHRYVLNLAQMKFGYIIEDIKLAQTAQEHYLVQKLEEATAAVKARAVSVYDAAKDLKFRATEVVAAWWKLADDLMFKYADGFVSDESRFGKSVGYPKWWLDEVGYSKTEGVTAAGAATGEQQYYPRAPNV